MTESRSEVTFEVIRGQVEEQNRILAPIIAVMILAVVVTAFIGSFHIKIKFDTVF